MTEGVNFFPGRAVAGGPRRYPVTLGGNALACRPILPYRPDPRMSANSEMAAALQGLEEELGAEGVSEVVALFLSDSLSLYEEIRAAHRSGDQSAFTRAAHSLKSTAAAVGAGSLSAACREAELLGRESRLAEASSVIPAIADELGRVRAELEGYRPAS